ncbi:radical SAM protein [Nevskia soli]|jgi:MoaA/NifB/PqqE/SkfB family radical SAM enzyme|uniref:radical SAM protein n=1 Tax=Nevskia soli TaxID=418856 RepID=UPI0015D6DAD7|nr:radical SAM protein [Nevskia soli]
MSLFPELYLTSVLQSIQAAPDLPEHLRDEVRVNWYMTQWCNYSCPYCPVLVFHKRTKSGKPQPHAFDYYPVEKWLELFDTVQASKLHIHLTGGEPFLDRENLRALLRGFAAKPRIHTYISTNGAWDPAYFADVDKSRIFLDIGFHPTQTSLNELVRQVVRIREAGFNIAIVNYVLSPENTDIFDEAFARLSGLGFYVHVSPMFPTGEHISREVRTDREMEIVVRHNTRLDLHYKVIWPEMNKRLCFYPALNYSLGWDGGVQVSCFDGSQNAFEHGFPALPRQAVACPQHSCIGCCEMYRAIVDEPLYSNPLKIFTHRDLAQEVSAYRRDVRSKMTDEEVRREVRDLQAALATIRKKRSEEIPHVTVNSIKPALPEGQNVIGYVDAPDSKFYVEARSRDRIMLTGWLASAHYGAPLKEIRFRIGDRQIGSVKEFYPRPDVAAHFGRENWLMSGWRTMIYLPALPPGEHGLIVEGVDPLGSTASIPPWPVRISE